MKFNLRVVATLAIVIITCHTLEANSFDLPSLSVFKGKSSNRSNTSDSKNAKSTKGKKRGKGVPKKLQFKRDPSELSFKQKFLKYSSMMYDPVSKDFPPNFRRNYAYFLLVFSLLLSYGVYGCFRNKKLACKWSGLVLPVLEDHFAYVERDKNPFKSKTWNTFEMYCSGRTSCRWMKMELELVKRQCFWHENLLKYFYPEPDRIEFEVNFDALDTVAFGVTRKTMNKAFLDFHPHLVPIDMSTESPNNTFQLYYCSLHDCKELSEEFRVYVGPNDKAVTQLVNYTLHQFHNHLDQLDFIYISNVVSIDSKIEKWPTMHCLFKTSTDFKGVADLTKAVINVADYCKNFSLASKTRESASKEWKELEAVFNKANKDHRDEKKEEEQEMTTQKVKKLEEKMAKKSKPMTGVVIKVR